MESIEVKDENNQHKETGKEGKLMTVEPKT